MPAYLLIYVLVSTVILAAVVTLVVRSGYRIGYRDAISGRPPRIMIFGFDDNEEDDA